MVNAPTLSRESVLSAVRAGHFYSSCGPEFHTIICDGTSVSFETSAVQFARLVGPTSRGKRIGSFDGTLFTEGTLEVPEDWAYSYLEIEDVQGRRAWTNTLWVE